MNAVYAADWIFPVSGAPLFRHAIEVSDGRITKIRSAVSTDDVLSHACILPGFVNAHTHLAYTAFQNLFDDLEFFPWIRRLTEAKAMMTREEIIASTEMGIAECLKSGITTVADLCDMEPALEALSHSSVRGIFYLEIFGVEKDEANRSWEEFQSVMPDLRERYTTDRLRIGVSPHACYTVRPDLYSRIAKWAVREQLPVSFHLAESRQEEEFIGKRSGPIQDFLRNRAPDWEILGATSVSHLEKTGIFETQPLLAHLVQVKDADLDILEKYRVSIAHCPKSNARFGHGIAPLVEMMDRKFAIGIGTDSSAGTGRLDLLEEARLALLQQRNRMQSPVSNAEEMLRLMTIGGARALRMEDEIGSLDIGKHADFTIVRIPPVYDNSQQVLNHLIFHGCPADIIRVVISGEPVQPKIQFEDLVREMYRKFGSHRI